MAPTFNLTIHHLVHTVGLGEGLSRHCHVDVAEVALHLDPIHPFQLFSSIFFTACHLCPDSCIDLQCSHSDSESKFPKYIRATSIYPYVLCSLTFLHHFSSAFGRRFSVPGIIDFASTIGEVVLFSSQATTRQWASMFLPNVSEYCPESPVSPIIIGRVEIGIIWAISLSLFLLTVMRIAEAFESEGHYFWTIYDVTMVRPTSTRTQDTPTVVQVLTGVELWRSHFKGEGKWIVRSRAIVALLFISLLLVFALNTLIIGPSSSGEAEQISMKLVRTRQRPVSTGNVSVLLGLVDWHMDKAVDLSPAVTLSHMGSDLFTLRCSLISYGSYLPYEGSTSSYLFTHLECEEAGLGFLIHVNFTTLRNLLAYPTGVFFTEEFAYIQVILGHSKDSLNIIRRTQLPVVLQQGTNVLGFDKRYRVQQFRDSFLSTFGLFAPFDEFTLSDIVNIQPNHRAPPTSGDTASLLILFGLSGFPDVIIQDYSEKTIMKGLSNLGGLWTFLAGIFIPLFGSSLVRVVFGAKPLSIFGLAHSSTKNQTMKRYRDKYPHLDSDIAGLHERPGLMTLLIDHLVDLDLLSRYPTAEPSDAMNDGIALHLLADDANAIPDRPDTTNEDIEIRVHGDTGVETVPPP